MKKIFLSFLLFAFVQVSFAQVKWTMDPYHSNIQFSVEHNGISFVDGYFEKFNGTVTSKGERDFEEAEFDFTVDVNTINTRIDARNTHLLSGDFFDAQKYPNITLKNAKLYKKHGNKYYLKGDLTLKDVTKTVIFDVVKNGQFTDGEGAVHVGFTAISSIDRTDFNINYDDKLPSGVDAVGKEIKIIVNTELIKK